VSVVGYRARNHPQQVRSSGPMREVDDRATTLEDFGPLNVRFGFTVDAAASAANAKCERFWTVADDGLAQPWAGERVWCNPPYSHPNIGRWIRKAWAEGDAALIVMLLPANRTEQTWWQAAVEPFRDRPDGYLRTEFLPGRMRFIQPGQLVIGANERPPFGCCLLIWDGAHPNLCPSDWDAIAGQGALFGLSEEAS
jgi:phage N-6-adenine-methyltransferase